MWNNYGELSAMMYNSISQKIHEMLIDVLLKKEKSPMVK